MAQRGGTIRARPPCDRGILAPLQHGRDPAGDDAGDGAVQLPPVRYRTEASLILY